MTKALLTPVIAAMLFGLTACSPTSDDGGSAGEPNASPSVSPSVSPTDGVDEDNVSPEDLPKAPKVTKPKGDIRALELTDCPVDAGKVTATGTVTSSAKQVVDYVVSISWTTSAGDVMGRGDAVLKAVQPGESADFKIRAIVKDGATRCVPGVVYGIVR